jgi:hypothetical protein
MADGLQTSICRINKPGLSIKKTVIPAEAGIQLINKSPRKWDNTWFWPYLETCRRRLVLSASQNIFNSWIPASAGMTA